MSDSLALTLARAIRAERARAGISQTELGHRLGLSQSTIASIESGTRRLYAHELPDVCSALEVTLMELLQRAERSDRNALGL